MKDDSTLSINAGSSSCFSKLIKKYHLSHNIQIADCFIASICIDNNLPLFTLNTKDYRFIPGLKLIILNL